jgi:hypothetical protein
MRQPGENKEKGEHHTGESKIVEVKSKKGVKREKKGVTSKNLTVRMGSL